MDRFIGIPLLFLAAVVRSLFFKRLHSKPEQRKILVIKLSALGDAVLLLPSLFRLRDTFKDAEFVFLGGASNAAFLKNSGIIDRFESFSLKTLLKLAREKYTIVIDYEQWMRTTPIFASCLRSALIAGFNSSGQYRHSAYDLSEPLTLERHMAENFWRLTAAALKKCGRGTAVAFKQDRDECRNRWRPFFIDKARHEVKANLLNDPYVIFHPGCGPNGIAREWPLQYWRELLALLKVSDPALSVYVTGQGAHEAELAKNIAEAGAISLVGRLTYPQLILALAGARHVFVPNTGIMHLSSFLSNSTIALSGPTNSYLWGPLWSGHNIASPLQCAPCLTWGHDYGCSDPVCLKAILPVRVGVEAVRETNVERAPAIL